VQVNIPVKMLEYIILHKKAKKIDICFAVRVNIPLIAFNIRMINELTVLIHRTCFDYIEDSGSGCYGSAVLVIF
jgi:hypothetical protein